MEASYFNKSHSVWEPLLEPLELTNKRLQAWRINLEVSFFACTFPSLSHFSLPNLSVSVSVPLSLCSLSLSYLSSVTLL